MHVPHILNDCAAAAEKQRCKHYNFLRSQKSANKENRQHEHIEQSCMHRTVIPILIPPLIRGCQIRRLKTAATKTACNQWHLRTVSDLKAQTLTACSTANTSHRCIYPHDGLHKHESKAYMLTQQEKYMPLGVMMGASVPRNSPGRYILTAYPPKDKQHR